MGEVVIALLGAIAGVALAAVCIVSAVRKSRQVLDREPSAQSTWVVDAEAGQGRTTILVRKGRQVMTVSEVRDDDPTWQLTILAAQAEAEHRAAVLNSGPQQL